MHVMHVKYDSRILKNQRKVNADYNVALTAEKTYKQGGSTLIRYLLSLLVNIFRLIIVIGQQEHSYLMLVIGEQIQIYFYAEQQYLNRV